MWSKARGWQVITNKELGFRSWHSGRQPKTTRLNPPARLDFSHHGKTAKQQRTGQGPSLTITELEVLDHGIQWKAKGGKSSPNNMQTRLIAALWHSEWHRIVETVLNEKSSILESMALWKAEGCETRLQMPHVWTQRQGGEVQIKT